MLTVALAKYFTASSLKVLCYVTMNSVPCRLLSPHWASLRFRLPKRKTTPLGSCLHGDEKHLLLFLVCIFSPLNCHHNNSLSTRDCWKPFQETCQSCGWRCDGVIQEDVEHGHKLLRWEWEIEEGEGGNKEDDGSEYKCAIEKEQQWPRFKWMWMWLYSSPLLLLFAGYVGRWQHYLTQNA